MTDPVLLRAQVRKALLLLLRESGEAERLLRTHLSALAPCLAEVQGLSAQVDLLLGAAPLERWAEWLSGVAGSASESESRPAVPAAKAPLLACVYAPEDKQFFSALARHLSPITTMAKATLWHVGEVLAGDKTTEHTLAMLESADMILVLLSPDLFRLSKRILRAILSRRRRQPNILIPIKIRPVLLRTTPFAKLAVLPRNKRAIASFKQRDQAWLDVVQEICAVGQFQTGALSQSIPISASVEESHGDVSSAAGGEDDHSAG